MPVLKDVRREKFCQLYVHGKVQGRSQADIYTSAGFKPKDERSAEASASRLLSTDIVRARVAELAAPAAAIKRVDVSARALITKSEHLIERGLATDQLGAVGRGIELQGKLGGALIDRVEVGAPGAFEGPATPEAILETMVRHLGRDEADVIVALRDMADRLEQLVAKRAKLIVPHISHPS